MLADGIRVREEKSQSIPCLEAHVQRKPRAVKIELSSLCNFRCKMCSNAKSKVQSLMTDSDFAVAMAQLAQMHPAEIGVLFLGESTLHPKLPEIIKQLKHCTDYVFLTTNGLLVDRSLAQKLIISGLDSLKWSVNWWSEKTFADQTCVDKKCYSKILSNIATMHALREEMKSKMRLYASVVTSKEQDVQGLPYGQTEFLCKCVKPYVDEIVFNKMTNHGGVEDGKACSCISDGQIPCPRLFNNMYIRSNLDVVCCCNGFTDDFKIGNLHESTLLELWNSQKMVSLRKKHIDGQLDGCVCTMSKHM